MQTQGHRAAGLIQSGRGPLWPIRNADRPSTSARTASISRRDTATHPSVAARSGRARWKKMALPDPATAGEALWFSTTTMS